MNDFKLFLSTTFYKVTLQVLGNVKSCLSIAVSVAIFRTAAVTAAKHLEAVHGHRMNATLP